MMMGACALATVRQCSSGGDRAGGREDFATGVLGHDSLLLVIVGPGQSMAIRPVLRMCFYAFPVRRRFDPTQSG